MKYLLRIMGFANGQPCHVAGQFLQSFDFEANGGRGHGVFTNEPHTAHWFPDKAAALDFWQTQSTTNPLRPDGRPNRPMTASTVSIEEYEVGNA